MRLKLAKTLFVVVGCLLSTAAIASAQRSLQGRVIAVSATPSVTSGFAISWITIMVIEDGRSESTTLKLAYVSAKTRAPNPGEHCAFTVHGERSGNTHDSAGLSIDDSTVVDSFHCGWSR